MEEFEMILDIIVKILDGFSIIVLLWGVISAVKNFILARIINKTKMDVIRENTIIKNSLGSYILLSLEILIAADIIETILNPDLNDILILASVVVIRTVISFFLNKEIKDGGQGHYDVSVKAKNRLNDNKPFQ